MKIVPYEEQETSILLGVPHLSPDADIYTCMPAMIRKLKQLKEQYPDQVNIQKEDDYGIQLTLPREWVKIKPKRVLSEQQRQQIAQNLKHQNQNDYMFGEGDDMDDPA